MSKNIIIAIVAVVVVVAAVGGYLMMNNPASAPTTQESNNSAAGTQEAGKKMAFSEFLKQGGSYECTINQYVGDTSTQGKAYISNGMVRGEFDTQVQGMNIHASLIVRDGYTYTWTSALPTMGFKAKVVENTTPDTSTGTSGQYSFDANQIGDYDCQAWPLDESKFVVPTSVTFQAIN